MPFETEAEGKNALSLMAVCRAARPGLGWRIVLEPIRETLQLRMDNITPTGKICLPSKPRTGTMKDNLPDFAHAFVDDVMLGPRRELTLIVRPLIWTGSKGSYGEPVRVRFGGIFDFEEVQTFLPTPRTRGRSWHGCAMPKLRHRNPGTCSSIWSLSALRRESVSPAAV